MKKLFLLCIITVTAMACSDEETPNPNPTQDQIVGTWNYHQSLINGVDDGLLPCESEETIVFSTDGTLLESFFEEAIDGNCIFDESFSGTWTNTQENNYSLVFDDEPSEIYDYFIDGNLLFYQLTFDNGTPDDASDDFTESEVYIKQ